MTVMMFVLAMPISMAAAAMVVTVITTVVPPAIPTVFVIALVAHVVAQSAARTTASGCADQAARAATHAAAHHVATGRAQGATDSGFATAAFVGTHRTATRATQGCADGRAGVTPICWPTTEPKTPPNAPPTPASVVPPAMAAPLTRPRDNKRIEENFIEKPQEDDGAILRLYRDADNRKPTSGTGCIQFSKLLFCMGNLSSFCESLTTSERPLLCKSGLCASQKVGVTARHNRPAHHNTPNQAERAMIKPVALAASNRIATNFDVGVWLPSPVLSSGTSGFTSG